MPLIFFCYKRKMFLYTRNLFFSMVKQGFIIRLSPANELIHIANGYSLFKSNLIEGARLVFRKLICIMTDIKRLSNYTHEVRKDFPWLWWRKRTSIISVYGEMKLLLWFYRWWIMFSAPLYRCMIFYGSNMNNDLKWYLMLKLITLICFSQREWRFMNE